jgi:NAD(P)-dependent dehydrogenase (short-subunit alcohol dehydrogenase family)
VSQRPLENHRSLIVGGAGGIGRASARAILADGAHVTIAGRTLSKLEAFAAELEPLARESGGSIDFIACDGTDREQVKAAVAHASAGKGLDSAVAIPGGGGFAPVLAQSDDEFMAVIDMNLRPTFLIFKYASLDMIKSGGGSVVCISSTAAIMSSQYLAAYCAAKAAIDQFVRVAADEISRYGVRVNAVRPGLTATDTTSEMVENDGLMGLFLAEQPLPRPGVGEDQGKVVRFLAGPESSWITGEHITCDGGHTIRKFPDLEFMVRGIVGEEAFAAFARGDDPTP